MKKLVILIVLMSYLIWGISCTHNHNHEDQKDNIHTHEEEHNHEEHEHDSIYGILEIKTQDFQKVIHTSGKILPAQGDEITLTAIHDGVVVFGNKNRFPGNQINGGELLITISGKGLIHDNIDYCLPIIKRKCVGRFFK